MKFHTVQNVPILDEHVIMGSDGKPLARIDEKRLNHIAERNNQRIKETGDEIPLVIGHTKGEPGDYVPEEQQPEIVGYASNLKVGKFKNTSRKALHATFKFFKDKLDKVKKFPRRSVELWLSDWKIDPISLLGATTPERDLGLLQLSRTGKRVYRRVLVNRLKFSRTEGESVDNEKLVQDVIHALQQTDVWKFMEQLKSEVEGHEGEGEQDGLPPEEGMEGHEAPEVPEVETPEGEEPPPHEGEEDEGEEGPEKYSSVAGGSNTYTQSFGQGKMKKSHKHEGGSKKHKLTYSREEQQTESRETHVKLARLERANRGLQDAYNEVRIKLQRGEREKDLMALQAAGYDFDINEELEWLQGLPEEQYEYHFDRLRKRYSRSPVGSTMDLENTRAASTLKASQRSKDEALKVAEYARKKGISYEDALSEMSAS